MAAAGAGAAGAAARASARGAAWMHLGVVATGLGAGWLSHRRQTGDPVFRFWRTFEDEAQRAATEAREKAAAEPSSAPEAQASGWSWLERDYLRFTRALDGGDSDDEGSAALADAEQRQQLDAARRAHASEIYFTLSGHLLGGLAGYSSKTLQRWTQMRGAMGGVYVSCFVGLWARYLAPEVMMYAAGGRQRSREAQQIFVHYLASQHERRRDIFAQRAAQAAETAKAEEGEQEDLD